MESDFLFAIRPRLFGVGEFFLFQKHICNENGILERR